MNRKHSIRYIILVLMVIMSVFLVVACSSKSSTTTLPPGGGEVVQSDSIILGEIRAVREEATGYPWEVDVLIVSSESVGDLPNPTKDKVGQVITAKTDEDASAFSIGESISARVKYVGDVPKPGISLYIYDVKAH